MLKLKFIDESWRGRMFLELPLLLILLSLTWRSWFFPLFTLRQVQFGGEDVNLWLFWLGYTSLVALSLWIVREVKFRERKLKHWQRQSARIAVMVISLGVALWSFPPFLYERLAGYPPWKTLHPAYITNMLVAISLTALAAWAWWPVMRRIQRWSDEEFDFERDEFGRRLPSDEEMLERQLRELHGDPTTTSERGETEL